MVRLDGTTHSDIGALDSFASGSRGNASDSPTLFAPRRIWQLYLLESLTSNHFVFFFFVKHKPLELHLANQHRYVVAL